MKKLLILIVCSILLGCTTTNRKVTQFNEKIHPDFIPHVNAFLIASNGLVDENSLNHITITYAEMEGSTVGLCMPRVGGNEILIRKSWWERNTDQRKREELIFHELGHCLLWREHTHPNYITNLLDWIENISFEIGVLEDKGYLPDGCPASYMHPRMVGDKCGKKHYDYYVKELFGFISIEEYETQITKFTVIKDEF